MSSDKRTVCLVKHSAFTAAAWSPMFSSESWERIMEHMPCWEQGFEIIFSILLWLPKPHFGILIYTPTLFLNWKQNALCFWGLVTSAEPLRWDQSSWENDELYFLQMKTQQKLSQGPVVAVAWTPLAKIHLITSWAVNKVSKLRV